jgi:hypothetical protein
MWQTHYYLAVMRMRELEAEADRQRRWQLQDRWNGRATAPGRAPNHACAGAARAAAMISRGAARFAVRLDGRVCVDANPERLLRDA